MQNLIFNLCLVFSIVGSSIVIPIGNANAEIPAWILKKLQDIKPQAAEGRTIIIPGWNNQQAQVLAETFITGKVDSIVGLPAEEAMYEVGEYKGNKTPLIVAKGTMKGPVPLGPSTYIDPKVTMVFDRNGNLLKREFELPLPSKPIQFDLNKFNF